MTDKIHDRFARPFSWKHTRPRDIPLVEALLEKCFPLNKSTGRSKMVPNSTLKPASYLILSWYVVFQYDLQNWLFGRTAKFSVPGMSQVPLATRNDYKVTQF